MTHTHNAEGDAMYRWAVDLFPIARSITGEGVRETLQYLSGLLPGLKISSVSSGTKVFDWTVPDEWTIREAWIESPTGERIIDYKDNNLHVVSYSEPVNKRLMLPGLEKHLYSIPDSPAAIPYVTSYYGPRWGFCLTDFQRQRLKPGEYRAYIDSDLKPGVLNYGELVIPGDTDKEIFFSTYICHPSLANDGLSGIVVAMALALWILSLPRQRYTYRFVFVPETIGSLAYLWKNMDYLRAKVIAGYNVTCIGDNRCYSYLPSRDGNTVSDKAAKHVLEHIDPGYKQYTWLDRGSDERQYCAPGIDLPIASIMRSKYEEYPEYHTSSDDLRLISPRGLQGGFEALRQAIEVIENNCKPVVRVLGEPHLGSRNLYPTISSGGHDIETKTLRNFISYCDGKHTLLDIAETLKVPFNRLHAKLNQLVEHGLVEIKL